MVVNASYNNNNNNLENETHKVLWDFEIQVITLSRPDLEIKKNNNNKKENLQNCGFSVPADHRVKLKKSEKKDKYLDLCEGIEKLWNMKVTEVPNVNGVLGTVTKELVQGHEDLEITGRVETIQTTALSRSVRIPWRVLETWGDVLSLKLQLEKPSINAGGKNS